jgi:hypothetical protein
MRLPGQKVHSGAAKPQYAGLEGRAECNETLKKGVTIAKGTAIATFVNGRFISGHGHAAFYNGYFYDNIGDLRISVIEQYKGTYPTNGVKERPLPNEGKDADGNWSNRSNNGRAFSIILLP